MKNRLFIIHIYKQATDWFREKVVKYLSKEGFFKGFFTLVGATALGQILTIFSSLILTRLYSPEDFGILAVFTSLLSHLLVFSSLRYEWAIPLANTQKKAIHLVFICLIINIIFTFIVSIIILLFKAEIATLINAPTLANYLWLLPLVLFFAGCYQVFNYWALRNKAFTVISHTKVTQTVSKLSSQILLGLVGAGSFGLLIGAALNSIIGTGKLALFFQKTSKYRLEYLSKNKLFITSHQYSRFPKFSVWSSLVNTAGLGLPIILITFFYGSQIAGSFAFAQRITSIPAVLIGSSISQVFLANITSLINQNSIKLKVNYNRMSLFLLVIGLLIGGILLLSPIIFPILFGKEWYISGIIVPSLVPMFITHICVSPLSMLEWLGKQNWMLAWNLLRLSSVCLTFFITDYFNASAVEAILFFSINMSLLYVLLFLLNNYIISKKIDKLS